MNQSLFDESINIPYLIVIFLQFPIEGTVPEPRHSHTASSYQGGAVVFGGLDKRGAPLGDVALLKPNGLGFTWETLDVQPSPVSRSGTNQQVMFHW